MNLWKEQFWKHVVEKVRNKLTRWKERVLSFAGCVCLIKSLSQLFLYFIYPYKAPKKCM